MKSPKTPKIVIGAGLLAVYAAILSAAILRDGSPRAVTPAEQPAAMAPAAATAAPVNENVAKASGATDPGSTADPIGPETASNADEAQPVSPEASAPADSDDQTAAEGNEEDGPELMVGN